MTIGDAVEWTSQSAGVTKTKRGTIIGIVPRGAPPPRQIKNPGACRDHESYVVRVEEASRLRPLTGRTTIRYYWPRVTALTVVP